MSRSKTTWPEADLLEWLRRHSGIGNISDECLWYRDRPVEFVNTFFRFPKDEKVAPYQSEALEKLAERRRASLRGPHGLGKTALAAWTILWFACTRPEDTKIPTTASAWRQLEKFLWPEVHKWYRYGKWEEWEALGGIRPEMFMLKLKVGIACEAFALASDNEALIEGAHGTNLLYVFDESKAVPDKTWDAAEGAFATGDAYWLAISTPGDMSGRFYDIHRRAPGLEDWWVRHVTLEEAIKAGRISREWAEARKRQWGEESPVYQARVLGEFPTQAEDALISLKWLEAARLRELDPGEDKAIVGLDVAYTGADDSAQFIRQGPVVLSGEWWHGHELMATTGKAKSTGLHINVDSIGIGAGVYSRLRELRHPASPVNVASKKVRDKEHFLNKRAEFYWGLRERFRSGDIDLSRLSQQVYNRLSGELTAIKFEYMSTGQIRIEPKPDMKKRLGHSPDLADALMLSFAPTRRSGIHI